MQKAFRLCCPDALSSALRALYEDRLRACQRTQVTVRGDAAVAAQSRLAREQCDELLRILTGKRKRVSTMTEGERADHERWSRTTARCGSI